MKEFSVISGIFIGFLSCSFSSGNPAGNGSDQKENRPCSAAYFFEESCCADDSECQDGLWCNGRELCDCWGECKPGNPPDCDDLDECTEDVCNEALDRCDHNPIPDCCHTDLDCNDDNPCTRDVCNAELCAHADLPDGTTCGPGSTECYLQQCRGGVCVEFVDVGADCSFTGNVCFDPGTCRADGLCQPILHPPANDQCGGVEAVALSGAGSGSADGSTVCALHDYTGSCGGTNTPDVVYSVSYTVSNTEFQLYSYNVILNADFNSVLYARADCANAASEVLCNDDCVSNPILNCGFYGLGPTDSALNLGPAPTGSSHVYYFIVDADGGLSGDFVIEVNRISHANNPCRSWRDNVRVVDATAGGVYRGNIDGYADDLMDAGFNWIKTPCHGADVAGFDWPARAWFKLQPAVNTTYRIRTNEGQSAAWFDTVIEVWDNSLVRGCDGIKTYITCAHINNRNNDTRVDNLLVPAGSTYLVGISSYGRPVGGDYHVRFSIL